MAILLKDGHYYLYIQLVPFELKRVVDSEKLFLEIFRFDSFCYLQDNSLLIDVVAGGGDLVIVAPVENAIISIEFTDYVKILQAIFFNGSQKVLTGVAIHKYKGKAIGSLFAKTLEILPEGAVVLTMRHTIQTIVHKKYSLPLNQVPVERVPFDIIARENLEWHPFRNLLVVDIFAESLACFGLLDLF